MFGSTEWNSIDEIRRVDKKFCLLTGLLIDKENHSDL